MQTVSHIVAACVFAKTEIATATELRALGFPAYVPCETIDRTIMGRKRRFRRPALPGYVFVQCQADDLSKIRALETVYGFVATTLADGSRKPASIAPEAVAELFLAELFGELDYTSDPAAWAPALGERVRVKSGRWPYIFRVVGFQNHLVVLEPDKGGTLKVRPGDLELAA